VGEADGPSGPTRKISGWPKNHSNKNSYERNYYSGAVQPVGEIRLRVERKGRENIAVIERPNPGKKDSGRTIQP
jgi:hypothetical protein